VIGDGSSDKDRHRDVPQVQRRSQHAEPSGPGEQVAGEDVQELAVQRAGQIGASAFQARMSKAGGLSPIR
jgi:hypothetical protein